MRFTELIKFSVQSLWRRKLRTFLTVLGVMIGTASIVVMMSIGVGLDRQFTAQIESSSTLTLITVYGYNWGEDQEVSLTRDVVEDFANIENVTCSSPVYSFPMMARCGKYEGYLNVYAVDYEMLQALKLPILEGQMPERGDPIKFLVGRNVGYNFYDPNGGGNYYMEYDQYGNPVNEAPVNVKEDSIFVVYDTDAYWNAQSGTGDMPKKYIMDTAAIIGVENSEYGYSMYDYNVYADLEAVEDFFQKTFKKNPWPNQKRDSNGKAIYPMIYDEAYVLVNDVENVAAVQKQITDMGFQAYSEMEYLNMVREQTAIIQYVLAGIGSISLIVAAIGIMNTMLMSIFERTKEIGIYKVLGCSMPNIRSMFLSEAVLIGFVGGVCGIVLSYLLSLLLGLLFGGISVIPIWLALAGLGVAMGVGTVAGISPALRAMRLSPLEAIRSL